VVKDLRKEYPHGDHTVPVLRNVDMTLYAGDMIAIVGASGVGKSTLLHVLGTLDLPTAGSILFNDEEITRMDPNRLAYFRNREIGFVFQFHHLLPEFTALENVMMPALIQRLPRAQAQKRAHDILGRVGLARRLTHKPSELSGGEQQRVALARAMVLEPSLLLADEPTGNLDKRTGEEIHELFLELNREHGSTLLVVTHNLELAKMMPRCLHMLDGGGLAERDNGHIEPDSESASESTSETASESASEFTSETASESASESTSETASESASESTSETASESASEPASDPESHAPDAQSERESE
jgi:lipoprotein-releasing system ATP-binding protein